MAVLAAYDIADLQPWASLQVYTVGAPRPGNRAFARQYNAKVPHTWHVINPQVRQLAAPTPHMNTQCTCLLGSLCSCIIAHLLVPRDMARITDLARTSTCLYVKKTHVSCSEAKQYANTVQVMVAQCNASRHMLW